MDVAQQHANGGRNTAVKVKGRSAYGDDSENKKDLSLLFRFDLTKPVDKLVVML